MTALIIIGIAWLAMAAFMLGVVATDKSARHAPLDWLDIFIATVGAPFVLGKAIYDGTTKERRP